MTYTYFGQTADGQYPAPGTAVKYRCEFCRKMQEGIQPEPGRVLSACQPCAQRIEAGDDDGS